MLTNSVNSVNPDVQKDDSTIVEDVQILNFEGNVTVVDEGDGKVTVTVGQAFAKALFDNCTPLFNVDENCNVELLEECG